MRSIDKEKKTLIGYVIIGICVFIFGLLATSAFTLKEPAYNEDTLCRKEVNAHTVILLDKTDTLSRNQQRFILSYINKEKDELRKFEKLSIFSLTESTYMNPDPIFSKCNPGLGKNANRLYQNPKKIDMRFNSFFSKPLEENMKNMLSDNTGSKSPILEMIKELSIRSDFNDSIENRTLIIISDLMHHTQEYSHYRNSIKYSSFSRMQYAYEVATTLNSVNIKIVYLLRDKLKKVQGKSHLSFWKNYFEDMGANIFNVRNIK